MTGTNAREMAETVWLHPNSPYLEHLKGEVKDQERMGPSHNEKSMMEYEMRYM